jgi:hypothetical protein
MTKRKVSWATSDSRVKGGKKKAKNFHGWPEGTTTNLEAAGLRFDLLMDGRVFEDVRLKQ